jgi:hypothetical protein
VGELREAGLQDWFFQLWEEVKAGQVAHISRRLVAQVSLSRTVPQVRTPQLGANLGLSPASRDAIRKPSVSTLVNQRNRKQFLSADWWPVYPVAHNCLRLAIVGLAPKLESNEMQELNQTMPSAPEPALSVVEWFAPVGR